MIESTATFRSYCLSAETWAVGTEHVVELSESEGRFVKLTKPYGFGLVPGIKRVETKESDPSKLSTIREGLEFFAASPMEYLRRWRAANELFGDDVQLVSVVKWKGGEVSFVVTQPQYHGVPADEREIERYFQEAGWERLRDPSGHLVFYNYAFGVIVVDAAPRNCYINEGGLQPFDVILCEPD